MEKDIYKKLIIEIIEEVTNPQVLHRIYIFINTITKNSQG